MFFYGIHETKKRVIEILQDLLNPRPLFEDVLISNHYPKNREREKVTVIVSGSSADQVRLSPDDYMSTNRDFSSLAKVEPHPGYFLEWARDDNSTAEAIQNRVDPSIYYFTLKDVTDTDATLQIDVMGVARNEVVLFNYTGEQTLQLEHFPVVPDTLQLYVGKSLYPPNSPADFYDVDLATGVITLNREPPPGAKIQATYNWVANSLPDVTGVQRGIARTDILTGVLLGIGEEFVEGDRAVVIVGERKEPSSITFGGRLPMTLQFDTRSQDTPKAEKVVDKLVETLWAEVKSTLTHEGLEVSTITVGGEAAEPEDETGQEWAFQFSVSMAIEGEWQKTVPLLRRYNWGVVNLPTDVDILSATDEELVEASLRFLDGEFGPQEQLS